jgi:uroporphyrinogen decarboxylase
MGPQIWREFIKPQVRRLYQVVKEMGKIVYIHSCGDIQDILPELIEMGVQVYNPFQPEVMNVSEVFDKYYRKLTFHGGLSNQNTMPLGSIEDVRTNTEKLLKMGQKGSYIFSPSNCVTSNTPLENILVMIKTLKGQHGFRAG